ncbi:MAG: NlpC/P60 family protein [Lachnospiraceae bacterium]
MRKGLLCLLLAGAAVLGSAFPAAATGVNDVKKQQTETKKQLEKINSSIETMESERKAIRNQLNHLNEELVETILTLEVLETDLENKQVEIELAAEEYEEAKLREEQQYADMKKRIRFMYENGDFDYYSLLSASKNIADFLNKSELVQEVYKYDRELLISYEETKQQVAEWQAVLEEEQDELLSLQEDYEVQKSQLNSEIAAAESEAADFDRQLAGAKEKAKAYRATLQEQTAKIRRLEAEAAAAAAKESATSQSGSLGGKNTGNTGAGSSNSSGSQPSASGSGLGLQIAQYALQFVGNPYVFGGDSLTNGTDCSGFTSQVHRHFGISIPRSSVDQAGSGKEVSVSAVQAGDIIYYGNHVGIYIGNGKIVHASSEKTGIKVSSYTYRTPICARRYW